MSIKEEIRLFLEGAKRHLLVLVGPTASGKTELSLQIAEENAQAGRTVEIINADSRQLYRYLDIGTAKIRLEQMRGIPHHILSILDPKEEVTAAWFKREAERVIAEIHARGNIPLLVGGSMLYVSAIIDNLAFVERPDEGLRERLRRDLVVLGATKLYERLQALDPEGAIGIDPRNEVYLVRALEVCISTGSRLKEAKQKQRSPYDLFIMGIDLPREDLHRRIAERIDAQFAAGWVDEVKELLMRGYAMDDPGMHSVGYRDIASMLSDGLPISAVQSHADLRSRITAKTRRYARRQLMWWREDDRILWI